MLIVAIVIELAFIPFQQPHHCLLVLLDKTIKVEGFVIQFHYTAANLFRIFGGRIHW